MIRGWSVRQGSGLGLMLALAACKAQDQRADQPVNRDSAVTAALNDPIMSDPDLTSQNRGNSALSGGGPAQGDLPPDFFTEDEKTAARNRAEGLAGMDMLSAPAPRQTIQISKLETAITAQAVAAALGLGGAGCAARLE